MSKWLRRGFGNNNGPLPEHPHHPAATNEFPSPPRNDIPPGAYVPPPQTHLNPRSTPTPPLGQNMVGYGPPHHPQQVTAMDVEPSHRGSKYAPSSQPYARQESGGRNPDGSRRSASSSRRASRSSYSQGQPPGYRAGHSSQQQHFAPPPTSYKMSSTPPETVQPSFPPPAVTSDSTPPGDPVQRRPAYLLHRDLVIGKGSYGQVCIASRGESEGHTGGRSGKRKKFACKCVMLRSDPKYIAKLQEEVNVLRELRGHVNVIRLYDVFCVDNELFIITELGRGGDLFHLLTTHPKHGVTESYAGKSFCHKCAALLLEWTTLIFLFVIVIAAKTVAEMLSAVAFLHSRSICHRDLKLENWVLESGKDVWSPLKLIDFGLSTHFTRGQRLSRVVGSSYYVAP